jgi:alpha-1,3-rhamnosyl/mannosyltransferase
MAYKGRLKKIPRPLRPMVQISLDAARRGLERSRLGLQRLVRLVTVRLPGTVRWLLSVDRAAAARRAEPRLTIAVDIKAFWEPLTGIGWYLYCLLDRLKDRDDLRLRLYGPWMCARAPGPVVPPPSGPAIEMVRYLAPDDLVLPGSRLVDWLVWRERSLVRDDGNDVVFLPNYIAPQRFDRTDGAWVVTVHDLSVRRFPWTMAEETRRDIEARLEEALERAQVVLTDAEVIAREVVESDLAPDAPVVPVLLGGGHLASEPLAAAEAKAVLDGLGLESDAYALHVGTIEPRKNLDRLVRVWRAWRESRGGRVPPLLLVGKLGWKTDELELDLELGAREGWLVRPGYVTDHQLAALYAGARFLVFPSLYEGFGLPTVEAMALGTPVVLSDIGVFREIAGDAALFVEPTKDGAWLSALERIDTDAELRRRLAKLGLRRESELDWDRTAEETLAAFRRAAAKGGR